LINVISYHDEILQLIKKILGPLLPPSKEKICCILVSGKNPIMAEK